MESEPERDHTVGGGVETPEGETGNTGDAGGDTFPGDAYLDSINWWPDYPLTDEERAYLQADIEAEERKDIAWADAYEARRAAGTGQGPETTSPETG